MGGHVPEDILGLDLEEEAVGVCVEELATIPEAGCSRSRTAGAWRDPECSSRRTPGD